MKLLIIPLYLLISSQVPWGKISFHSGIQSSIFFDLSFILVMIKVLKLELNFTFKLERGDIGLLISTITLAMGGIAGIKALGLINPFQFVSLLFLNLVLIGPILEELIFRVVFNNLYPFERNKRHLLSGFIFSFSHALSMLYAPPEWYKFFYLQIIYTFILGIICSISYEKSKNILKPILLHICFNFVFFIVTIFHLV